MEFNDDFFEFIERHAGESPDRLRLKYVGKEPWIAIAVSHIASQRKAQNKLGGFDNSLRPTIIYPEIALEQCSSAQTALFHAELLSHKVNKPGATVLDMTCGLGIDTMAFALKGLEVTAVELNPVQAEIACFNFQNRSNITVLNADSTEFLANCGRHFDVIFIDPARRDVSGRRVYGIKDCVPDLTLLLPLIKEKSRFLLAKLSPMLDISEILRELPGIDELYVVGTKGECKELLIALNCEDKGKNDMIDVTIIVRDFDYPDSDFRYTLAEERNLCGTSHYAVPKQGDVLMIPSASLMKTNAYNCIAQRYGARQLSNHSHLFVADRPVKDFIGKQYRVDTVIPWSSAEIKRLAKARLEADITVRNFPMTASEIARRLKILPSSNNRLFATTTCSGEKILIFCTKALTSL